MVFEFNGEITHRRLKREVGTGVSAQRERGVRWLVKTGATCSGKPQFLTTAFRGMAIVEYRLTSLVGSGTSGTRNQEQNRSITGMKVKIPYAYYFNLFWHYHQDVL